ncbi:MAG TPA: DUF4058 family protein [Gemmataceae bacterium]|nr:DUF4058 family protein [Gemmataceae bacterium]
MPVHDWTRVDAGTFHDFHTVWLVALRNRLNRVLPTEYYAMSEQKGVGFGPDVVALAGNPPPRSSEINGGPIGHSTGALSVVAAPPQARFTFVESAKPMMPKRRRIVIKHVSGDRIIAIVEIVSPANKDRGKSLKAFASKVVEFLENGVHVLVIDLFPPTRRDPQGMPVAIQDKLLGKFAISSDKPLTAASYRAGDEVRTYIETFAVGDDLPDMPVFLDGDDYVQAPLRASYDAAFDEMPRRFSNILTAPVARGDAHGT